MVIYKIQGTLSNGDYFEESTLSAKTADAMLELLAHDKNILSVSVSADCKDAHYSTEPWIG